MKSTRTRAGAACLTALVAATLTACGGSSGGGSQADSATLTVALDTDNVPSGYDPLLYGQQQAGFFSSMYDSLFVTTEDGSIAPSLVTESETSPDGTTLTLTLRDGVTFTDGSTLDAELVKANLDRRNDPDLHVYGQLAEGGTTAITDVAVTDPRTVVVTWAEPQAQGEDNLADAAGMIVGEKAVADGSSLDTQPNGSGPYTLDTGRTTKGNTYTLTRREDAWNAAAYPFDTVVYKVITDPQARANAVVSGQADLATNLDASTLDLVRSQREVVESGGTVVGFPVVDKKGTLNPAFGDPNVRLALSYAIDRTTIVDELRPGARPTAQLFPEAAPGFDPALDEKYAYDPAKAEELLAAAGHPDLAIDLTWLGQPTAEMLAVQQQWKQVGVTLTFVPAASTEALFNAVRTEPLIYYPLAVGDSPLGVVQGVLVGGFVNQQGATDPDIDGALAAAAASTGAERDTALTALNDAITNKGWHIPIYEDFLYLGYDDSTVAAPSYAGTNGFLLLSSVEPAS